MNAQTFISKTQSIFSDNAGVRKVGRQASGPFVDEGRLAMLGAGDLRVFARKAARQFKAWRVSVLVDCSGSIYRDSKQEPMVNSVVGIADALKAAHVGGVDVCGFNAGEVVIDEALMHDRARFVDLFRKFRRDELPGGEGNHDGHFVRTAGRALLKAHEPGKVLLVFSDGQPHCDYGTRSNGCGRPGCGNDAFLRQDLISALGEVRRSGVIALGVGVQSAEVRQYYGEGHSTVVNELGELYTQTAKLIERHIIRG